VKASDEKRNGDRDRDRESDRDREIERYRQAATSALEQLAWVGGYLCGIRKPQLARSLARNREQIIKRIR
jgi:hypothetical protein